MKNSFVPYIILPETKFRHDFDVILPNPTLHLTNFVSGGVAALVVFTVGGVAVALTKAIEAEVAVLVAEDSNPVDQLEERKKL